MPVAIAIHGGAGAIKPEHLPPEKEKARRQVLEASLKAGHEVLKKGGAAIEAVEVAVKVMEDAPFFNAGKGSVLNSEGLVEMDASIMEGTQQTAGAVIAVKHLKNPITAARMVMNSPHVMLTGGGAELLAEKYQLATAPPEYFIVAERRQQWEKIKDTDAGSVLDHSSEKYGTVGAVALDSHGHVAAATSTGGMTNKWPGRIGDSPVIGAGTYANDNSCAVSCTGHGEYFLRSLVAYDVHARMLYANDPLAVAAQKAIDKVALLGGTGGLIAVDKLGNISMPFNTSGMYRGSINVQGEQQISIFTE